MRRGFGFGFGKEHKAGASYDADATTYFATVPDSFNAARKAIVNTLVTSLKAGSNNWSKLDRLWLMANTTSGNALISLVNPGSTAMTLVNAPAFVADQGFTGDGATSYINTNYNFSTSSVNYTQNSASLFSYNRTNSVLTGGEIGAFVFSDVRHHLFARYTGDVMYGNINTVGTSTRPNTNSSGLIASARTASNLTTYYRNGVSLGTTADASAAMLSLPCFILACSTTGPTASDFSTRPLSIAGMGSGAINHSELYTSIQDYMTSLGTQV